jgi:hypothetical protein
LTALVLGFGEDPPIGLALAALRRRGSEVLFVDQARMAEDVDLRWSAGARGITGRLRVGSTVVDVRAIRSVYHRLMDVEQAPPAGGPRALARARSVQRALLELLDVLPTRVVNRRRPMMSNNSKPYQSLLARRAGFAVPDTLVSNDAVEVARFARLPGGLVYKSTSSVRSIVSGLDESSARRLHRVRYLPTQFQRRVGGFNLRVHVVGRRLFATRVITTATDYRYASAQGATATLRPYQPTAALASRCLALAHRTEMAFVGIDLMVSREGVYCLEVNPSPAYSYFEEATGQAISEALAEYLSAVGPVRRPHRCLERPRRAR